MDAPVIVLAGVKAELRRPSQLLGVAISRSQAQLEAMDVAELWAMGALALLESWPVEAAWPVPLRPRLWRVGEKVGERGREVFDGLASGGTVPLSALLGTADAPGILLAAYNWATGGGLAQWEIAGARDFCVVRAAPTSSSDSASVAATTSPPPGGTD